jgi:hypothetical protein
LRFGMDRAASAYSANRARRDDVPGWAAEAVQMLALPISIGRLDALRAQTLEAQSEQSDQPSQMLLR